MKKTILKAALAALIISSPIAAYAITGDCVTCHTMHNSELGVAVAQITTGLGSSVASDDPIPNLLRADCMACHAQGTSANLVDNIPQVYHSAATDLAGGNFGWIDAIADGGSGTASNRAGHNVSDLFAGTAFEESDNDDANGAPPGNAYSSIHGDKFGTNYANFTCAGTLGCHGTRGQVATDTAPSANDDTVVRREGMSAIAGAHHINTAGQKNSDGYTVATVHSGQMVADGYRFIPGLKGYENETSLWQNASATDHNEYFGDATAIDITSCGTCHIDGDAGGELGVSAKMTLDSNLIVPNNSVSGFCSTCHGVFHSSGTENGSSGAFLRHPSDYVLPSGTTEYADYTVFNVSAPVARTAAATSASDVVAPGTDMVMCMSCHKSHASEFDYMLRFDYSLQTTGGSASGGCVACHTAK